MSDKKMKSEKLLMDQRHVVIYGFSKTTLLWSLITLHKRFLIT